MSTRATIKIIQEEREPIRLYHHSDGYPSGVGHDLKKYLSGLNDWDWQAEEIATDIVKGKVANDNSYEVANCQHGDEEYAYLIDCNKKSIKCYNVGWDDFNWTDDKLIEI